MKQIAILDDDHAFAAALEKEVISFFGGDCETTRYYSAEDLRNAVTTSHPDIALLDIRLDKDNGIALARELFPARCGTAVIFITGYIEYCTDVYEAEHIYFLLKPLQPHHLARALSKALSALETAPLFFSVRSGGTVRRINLSKVFYIEGFYRKLRIYMPDETLEIYGSISSLPPEVLKHMIHSHKSFLVNPDHIERMSANTFTLDSGATVPISHNNRAESRQRFLSYLAGQMEVH